MLLSFFTERREARRAIRKLRRQGFRRAALVHKTAAGEIQIQDPCRWRRALGAALTAVLSGFLTGLAFLLFDQPWPLLSRSLPLPVLLLAGGLLGALGGGLWWRRSRIGVERKLLENQGRWLVSGETVLILQSPLKTMPIPVALVRESGEIPPAIFILHPPRDHPFPEVRSTGVTLSPVQIREQAQRLARDQQVGLRPRRKAELLRRLEKARRRIQQAGADLSGAGRLEEGLPPTAEWILDNEYVVESQARDIQRNLPRRYYQQLPALANGPYRGLPRIYGLAKALVSHTELRLDRENILAFGEAYQAVQTLTIGELWAIPQMLRIALIEAVQNLAASALTELRAREEADFWANRLMTANRRDPTKLFSILAELAATQPDPSPYFAAQLVDHLYDEEAALAPVQSWLERLYRQPWCELNQREQNRQTKDQIAIGNAFTSLRHLTLLDWRQIFEHLSRVEKILRRDPAGVYYQMDFDTRDRYRRTVEELARGSGLAEDRVAQRAIDLAAAELPEAENEAPRNHVGTYLIGEGRPELARELGGRERLGFRLRRWVERRHGAVYFLGLGLLTALLVGLVFRLGLQEQTPGIRIVVALLLLIPASQLALEVLNYLVTRLLPPRALPKMDFAVTGLPDTFRTLVVVPMMLTGAESTRAEVEKLEIRYLANQEDNLLFSLFTDYTDADQVQREDDAQHLRIVTEGLEALNRRYGHGRFFLFHRDRTWSESEQKFIGWERKRGKLEELNRLLDGTGPEGAERLIRVGDPGQLGPVRFVITLDSDTQLPPGTARRLIETLAHPLNRLRFDGNGKIIAGYTIIQPRVTPTLPSTSASPFSRLFADAVGIDPYTKAVSDVHQDLTGEGSYHGKGIYEVRAFSRILTGRFPEARVLSHDLLEGAHVRVGLASDIELYDEFPRTYQTYVNRQQRWIRGDWQIADWIFPRVPLPGGGHGPNPLSGFNRWKIFDNLRRSLLPLAILGLLITSWLLAPQSGWIVTLLVTVQLLIQPLAQPFTLATTGRGWKDFSLAKVAHDLRRAAVDAALLPHQAGLTLDAIGRVGYRRLFSHRRLLQWTSAQTTAGRDGGQRTRFLWTMGVASLFSALVVWALIGRSPSSLAPAGPWLFLWFCSPLIGWLLNLRPPVPPPSGLLLEKDRLFLRQVARRTWRYFSDFVNAETAWLPPDNYQVFPRNHLALRTSPTNIGLWMVSTLAAGDFGYLTVDEVTEKLTRTMKTIEKLERFKGHLLNWYDIRTLTPLEPRYVSTVDSGNLLGALWSLEPGLAELLRGPILDGKAFAGLRDTAEILKRLGLPDDPSSPEVQAFQELRPAWEDPPATLAEALHRLRRLEGGIQKLSAGTPEGGGEAVYWAQQMAQQVQAWRSIRDRYLVWVEILAEKREEELLPLGPEALLAIRQTLSQAPSLLDLGRGRIACIPTLESIRAQGSPAVGPLGEWLDRLLTAFADSQWLAGEALGLIEGLIQDIRRLSDSIPMRFLYDPDRRLFSIGFNVSEGRLDNSYYDLLASEARLGSFVAIARGEVPVEHWFSLGRPYGQIGRRRVLLSWTGTMFEYLMPLVFQHALGNTLLDEATREAVAVQMAYGRRRRVPWGISESAYSDLDLNQTYQYKAFGVPELGLKRGLESQVVVAPYASLLAVALAPRETVRNLKQLAARGLLQDYGYYEAIDFSRAPGRESARGVIVQAYMAHHQGMGFLSLTNFLQGNPIRRRFHEDPRVRAVEPLLQERVPSSPPLHQISAYEGPPLARSYGEVAPSVSKFNTPHTATPKTQLLGNGRYSLMITNTGGGYSRWGNQEITRWRSDRTRDPWGTFCYLQEADPERLWSNTFSPVGGKVEAYAVNFALDRAVFQRTDHGIQTKTEVVVSPEDDVEIRRVTLVNRSLRTRRLQLTSYVELALAPHNADRQHPAFNKLFIRTEALPQQQALLAHRRSRGPDDPPVYVAHRLTLDGTGDQSWQFETDRRRFIGRGRTLANPLGIFQGLSNSQGFVLDPILSLRRDLTLKPGEVVQISLILAAGESRQQVLGLMGKYSEAHAIERALDFAWASAQLALRVLHIQPDEARRFQQLAGHLLYPNPLLRPPDQRLQENRKGQAGLWPYGISGDLPLALVTISEAREINLVRQLLQAHTYWRLHGLTTDLLILNEEASGYEQPLRERLEGLIQAQATITGRDQPGGVFLRTADQIPAEDLTLLQAAAGVVLVAARGLLPQQLSRPAAVTVPPEPTVRRRAPREPSAALPFLELPYFNSLGGFTPDGREYAIYLGPDTHTPAPWVNVIANPDFGTLVSETGAGFTWFGNSQRNRLTPWSNDPVLDPPGEALYLRDEETGVTWTPTAAPIREETAYRARHGAGYSVFEHNSQGIEQELTLFIPVDENGGDPIKVQRLRLRNDSARQRKLSLTYYVEWVLGEDRESSQMQVVTSWDDEVQALIARNRYHPEYGERVAFAALNPPAESYSGDRTSFIGRNRSLGNPAAMEQARLSARTGAGLDPCAVLRVTLDLAPGGTTEIICLLGQAGSLEEAHKLISTYREGSVLEAALSRTKTWWDDLLGAIEVHTPEPATDFLINRWLLYQSLSCRIWGRSAFYQSGGAFGFRDQLQDVTALVYAAPELAQRHILLAASRQFKEGDVQHWWHPPTGAGTRSRISDDPLWLPYVVAHYIRISGDVDLLHREVPFLEGEPLKSGQTESFGTPEIARERATLFEHCRRAVQGRLNFGPHGLPLIGSGDWNDGLNRVGVEGRGESVWLAWFLVEVLQGMSELSALLGLTEGSRSYQRERKALLQRVERVAWDGEWYLRGIFDDGSLLGSAARPEALIDSLPQSWAGLCGAADPERTARALESVWKHLVQEEEGLVLLFTPPFDQSQPSPGYIQAYPPGVRENGGQYTQAALWFAMALARQGAGSRAVKLLRLLNPIERARDPETVWRYGLEPYVAAADVYRLPGRIGQGGWSWYTGSAAWMYRAWIEEILGLKVRGETLQLDPVIPGNWEGFNLRYRHGEASYEIRVDNPEGLERGVVRVELDDQRLQEGVIPLERGLVKHRIVVTLGKPAPGRP
ncbi:MAG: glycosyl transferase [Deltaproteobacteria bacterium]|nr:glycosyl transferase [Deltaproteobacteria bacterium]